MPREQINWPRTDSAPDDQVQAHVSWLRDSHVQIGLECTAGFLRALLFENGQPLPENKTVTVFTPVLNRSEINRTIRVLRRARDQAYGADE